MANICANSVVFRAPSEKELADFLNDGLKADHPEYEPKDTLEEIARWISAYTQANPPFKRPPLALPALRLSSWMPTPAEYTRRPSGDWLDSLRPGEEIPGSSWPTGKPEVATEESIAEMKAAREMMLEESGQSDLYHYNLWKYSVKWDCPITDDSELDCGTDPSGMWYAGLDFDTPWGGPVAWAERLHARYPALNITLLFREDGNDVMGAAIASEGGFAELRGEALELALPMEFLPGGFFEEWEDEDDWEDEEGSPSCWDEPAEDPDCE